MTVSGRSSDVGILIVDDEAPARALLREYLEGLAGYAVVGECGNGFEAVKAVADLEPDLLLLDIQMPKLDGFEVLELIGNRIPVVFVTAYDEHALRAFEVQAVDYLLKPFSRDRLVTALERTRRRFATGESPDVDRLAHAARPSRAFCERILIRDGSSVRVVPVGEIEYIEASDDTILVHARGEIHRKSKRLSTVEAELDPERFVRIHRSYILNVESLASLELYAKNSRLAILTTGARLPVSRSGHARLRELL